MNAINSLRNESALIVGANKKSEELHTMSNFKMISPYCGLSRYDNRFFVYYLDSAQVRREYIFKNKKDADNFHAALKNLTPFMSKVPTSKREAYHQDFSDLLLKEVQHKVIIRTSPDAAAIVREVG